MAYAFYSVENDSLELPGKYVGQDSEFYPNLSSVFAKHSDAEFVD